MTVLRLLADDLTGALDSAAGFGSSSTPVPVRWQPPAVATGSLALRLDAYGVNAHSSVPGSGGNAILAAQVAARAVVDALSETIDVPYVGRRERAVNVGVIRGGIADRKSVV